MGQGWAVCGRAQLALPALGFVWLQEKKKGVFLLGFGVGINISHQEGAKMNLRAKMGMGAEIFSSLESNILFWLRGLLRVPHPGRRKTSLGNPMFSWNEPWDSSRNRILEYPELEKPHKDHPARFSWCGLFRLFPQFPIARWEKTGIIHFTPSYFHLSWFKSCFLRGLGAVWGLIPTFPLRVISSGS